MDRNRTQAVGPNGDPAADALTAGSPAGASTGHEGWALAIIQDAADGILTIDEQGRILWANPALLALFGYRWDELVGQNVKLLVPPPDRELHDTYIAHYLRTGQRRIIGVGREVNGLRKDGSTFPLYLTVCESTVAGVRVFGGIMRDLTRQKEAELELRRERNFTASLLDTAKAIILVLDENGRVVQFNRHMERLGGRSLGEVRNRDWIETFVPENERPRARLLLEQALSGTIKQGNVYPIVSAAGFVRQIEWFESLLDPADGHAGGLLCVGLDVSRRIEAERERRSYEDKLRSMTSELITSEERERRELAVALHDQIGQTLALAKIKLGGLRDAVPSDLAPAVTEIRDLVDQAVRSSRSLVLELGATVLHELGLEAALASLTDEVQSRHGIACALSTDDSAKPLNEEVKVALFRATRELLINVVKHATARCVEVSVRRVGSVIRIRVVDDGLGFAVPADGFHASKDGGFGLFSIQERLARLGGFMRVTAAPGRGSEIMLEAPLAIQPEH